MDRHLRPLAIGAALLVAAPPLALASPYVFRASPRTIEATGPVTTPPVEAPSLTLREAALPSGTVGRDWSHDFAPLLIPRGLPLDASVSWRVEGAPSWLRMDAPSGAASGKPDAKGSTELAVTATAAGVTATGRYTILVEGVPVAVTDVAAGLDHVCALTDRGEVYCWGFNDQNQLGNAERRASVTPMKVAGIENATALASGWQHSCAIVANGAVHCWGRGGAGKLGQNDRGDGTTSPAGATGVTGATAVAAGFHHTCAIVAAGRVQCWGSNAQGQLGRGTNSGTFTPTPPGTVNNLTGVTAIVAGENHTCAIHGANGNVSCWGSNAQGQVGSTNNSGTSRANATPLAVPLANVTALAAGASHTCSVASDGSTRCWGGNGHGQQMGAAHNGANPTPHVMVASGSRAVTAGMNFTCASTAQGVSCWGSNEMGQLGRASGLGSLSGNRPAPTDVAISTGRLTAGRDHVCALVEGGGVSCWGRGSEGQLGRPAPRANAAAGAVVFD